MRRTVSTIVVLVIAALAAPLLGAFVVAPRAGGGLKRLHR
jgi:hypothetical protein